MAKKDKKNNNAGLALACWIAGFLILVITFLVKQDDIKSNLKTTNFFERLFGSTPDFIANHEVKEEKPVPEETVITITPKEETKPKEVVKTDTEERKQEVVQSVEKVEQAEEKKVEKETKAAQTTPVKTESTVKDEKKSVEQKTVQTTNQKLYFVFIGEDGVVSRKQITRAVEKNDSPLVTNINLLLKGPNSSEESKGYKSLIPEGTKLLSASVKDGIAYLNFNENFEFNYVGVDGYLGQLMQIVYTATEFNTVKGVQFLVEGQKKDYLGSEGVWIGSPLSRASF